MSAGRCLREVAAWLGARDGLVRIAAFVAGFAILIAPTDFAARGLFGTGAGLLGHTGPGRLVVCGLLLGLALLFNRSLPRPLPFGLRAFPGWRGLAGRGWVFGIAGYLIYALLMRCGGAVDFRAPRSWLEVAGAIPTCALAGLAIATVEEVIFRGFLLRTAAGALPRWPAVILTGILFAFFHDLANPGDLLTEPADRMLFGGVFCLHVLLCASAIRTRSLHLGIGIHAGLVFGEALFRRLRLFDVVNDDSWFLGLDGDPRRGFFAWGLFLASVLLIPRLMGARAGAGIAAREPVAFAPRGPGWLVSWADRLGAVGPRGEFACWLAVAAAAIAVRAWMSVAIPLALVHDGSVSALGTLAETPVLEPRGGWLFAGAIALLAPHDPALGALVWAQHAAVLLAIGAMFFALRATLGRRATIPLAACALGCGLHGMPIYLAHTILPGALQFALTALAISLWALRLAGWPTLFAFAAALAASLQGFNALLSWPLVATILLYELIAPRPPMHRLAAAGCAALGAALPIAFVACLAPSAPRSFLNPSPQIPFIYASIAHLDPELKDAPPDVRRTLAPLLQGTPGMSPADRRNHFRSTVYRALNNLRPDPTERDALCLRLARGILGRKPLAACAAWSRQIWALLNRGSDNVNYPGDPDIRRTARYTQKLTEDPGAEIHRHACALLPRFEGRHPAAAPEWLVWFLAILPPILATTAILVASLAIRSRLWRWLAIGCLAFWLPALFRFGLIDEVKGRDIVGLLPIAMLTLSAAIAAACRATADCLRG